MEILLLLIHSKQGNKKEKAVNKKKGSLWKVISRAALGWLLLTCHAQPQIQCLQCNWRELRGAAMADWVRRV